ncbi:MAG: hypothetical protein AB7E60_02840 [Sphingobium sp.]
MTSITIQQALARVVAKERRAAEQIARNDAIKADLRRAGADPDIAAIAHRHGVPVHAVQRVRGWR